MAKTMLKSAIYYDADVNAIIWQKEVYGYFYAKYHGYYSSISDFNARGAIFTFYLN